MGGTNSMDFSCFSCPWKLKGLGDTNPARDADENSKASVKHYASDMTVNS